MDSTKRGSRSGQIMLFTYYFQKTFQHVFLDQSHEKKYLPKVKHFRVISSNTRILRVQTGFGQLHNVYFKSVQINRWLHLLSSFQGILLCDLLRKRINQKKFSFIATNNLIVLAFQWSVKYFFAPNSPLFQKSGGEKKNKKGGSYEAFCFSSQK